MCSPSAESRLIVEGVTGSTSLAPEVSRDHIACRFSLLGDGHSHDDGERCGHEMGALLLNERLQLGWCDIGAGRDLDDRPESGGRFLEGHRDGVADLRVTAQRFLNVDRQHAASIYVTGVLGPSPHVEVPVGVQEAEITAVIPAGRKW